MLSPVAQKDERNKGNIELPHWERKRNATEQRIHEEQQERIAFWRSGVLKAFGEENAAVV